MCIYSRVDQRKRARKDWWCDVQLTTATFPADWISRNRGKSWSVLNIILRDVAAYGNLPSRNGCDNALLIKWRISDVHSHNKIFTQYIVDARRRAMHYRNASTQTRIDPEKFLWTSPHKFRDIIEVLKVFFLKWKTMVKMINQYGYTVNIMIFVDRRRRIQRSGCCRRCEYHKNRHHTITSQLSYCVDVVSSLGAYFCRWNHQISPCH